MASVSILAREFATAACASSSSTIRAPNRATATTSATDTGPIPTTTSATDTGPNPAA